MAKFQIVSDLHFEFHYRDNGKCLLEEISACAKDIDALIVAGDLCSYAGLKYSLDLLCEYYKDVPVVYVPGNHEYYGANFARVDTLLSSKEMPDNLCVLRNGVATINDDTTVIGTTLWFEDRPGNLLHERRLSDFSLIGNFRNEVYDKNEDATYFLHQKLAEDTIVVTHHMPSMKCVAPTWKTSDLNRFFVCEMDSLIATRTPPLWICGHTHSNIDMMIDETRVVCNPFGYVQQGANPKFNPCLIVEV